MQRKPLAHSLFRHFSFTRDITTRVQGRGRRQIGTLALEPLEPRTMLASHSMIDLSHDAADDETGDREPEYGQISGRKWNDADGDGRQDSREQGLAGVTIYSDLNRNGRLDDNEPHTETMRDNPNTRFDEAGLYSLRLEVGTHVIREIVPDGFVQTFPRSLELLPMIDPADESDGGTTSVRPEKIRVALTDGEVFETEVALAVHPNIFRAIEVDVVASDPDVSFDNITGVVVNGGGGDISQFKIQLIGDGQSHEFDLQFVDAEFGGVLDTISVGINSPRPKGAHVVKLESGESIDGLNFGNRRLSQEPGLISGRKWNDVDGDGDQDSREPGLAGVTIYSDLNRNGRLDDNEPHTETKRDNPETDFDEAGLYSLRLEAGTHVIREIVPDGFVQTFPRVSLLPDGDPERPTGAHVVKLESGESIDGLDFGNRRLVRPIFDITGDGAVGLADLMILQQNMGESDDVSFSEGDFTGNGKIGERDFRLFARHFGQSALGDPVSAAAPLAVDMIPEDVVFQGSMLQTQSLGSDDSPSQQTAASLLRKANLSSVQISAVDAAIAASEGGQLDTSTLKLRSVRAVRQFKSVLSDPLNITFK